MARDFLDLEKAFDTISVPILLDKMQRLGIRGIPLNLLSDYLKDRKTKVFIEESSVNSLLFLRSKNTARRLFSASSCFVIVFGKSDTALSVELPILNL